MFGVGPLEILVILLIALIVVGPTRLPELSRSLGRALREFRRVQTQAQQQIREVIDLDDLNPLRTADLEPPTPTVNGPVAPPVDLGPPTSPSHRGGDLRSAPADRLRCPPGPSEPLRGPARPSDPAGRPEPTA